jgi:Family of unknown function (DUF6069)
MYATAKSPGTRARPRTSDSGALARAGAIAAVLGAVAAECFARIAHLVGVSLDAGSIGASKAEPIPLGVFALTTLIWSAFGVVLAIALARFAKHPARTFVVTTVVLTALSFLAPLAAGATAGGTKIVLALSHVVAAAIIIPALARRLPT